MTRVKGIGVVLVALLATAGIVLGIYFAKKGGTGFTGSTMDQVRLHNAQGIAFLGMDRLAEAAQQFQAAVALDPQYTRGHVNLGIVYFHKGDYEEALQALQIAEGLDPESPHVDYVLGRFNAEQQEQMDIAVVNACEAIRCVEAMPP